jgi:hypothetical protein
MRLLNRPQPEEGKSVQILTPHQSEKLADEVRSISKSPQDEPHIVFRLAYDAIRRRQMKEAGEGAEPPMQEAIDEATRLVQSDFAGFQPKIGEGGESNGDESPVVREMIGSLISRDPTDSTGLKWMLVPESRRQELRERYEGEWKSGDAEAVMLRFKEEVHDIHVKRPPQQAQYRELGQDAVE